MVILGDIYVLFVIGDNGNVYFVLEIDYLYSYNFVGELEW